MNLSEPFIRRPVATTLLMIGVILVGMVAYEQAAGRGAAPGRLSDHPGGDLLSGRKPGSDDVLGDRAPGAPIRPGPRAQPDDLDQLGRRLGHHPAVLARDQHRHRRAGGPGGDQCRHHLPAHRPAGAAHLQQGQSGRHPHPHPRPDLGDPAAAEDRGPRRHPPGGEDLAAARGRPGQRERRAEAGDPHPDQSDRDRRPRHDHGGLRAILAQTNINQAKGSFDGPHLSFAIGANDQLLSSRRYRRWWSPTRTARRSG